MTSYIYEKKKKKKKKNQRRQWHPTPVPCLENPMTEEAGGLQSMGSLGVGHDCVTFKETT